MTKLNDKQKKAISLALIEKPEFVTQEVGAVYASVQVSLAKIPTPQQEFFVDATVAAIKSSKPGEDIAQALSRVKTIVARTFGLSSGGNPIDGKVPSFDESGDILGGLGEARKKAKAAKDAAALLEAQEAKKRIEESNARAPEVFEANVEIVETGGRPKTRKLSNIPKVDEGEEESVDEGEEESVDEGEEDVVDSTEEPKEPSK